MFLTLFAAAQAASGNLVETTFETRDGKVPVALSILVEPPEPDTDPPDPDADPPEPDADPPQPDFELRGDVASTRIRTAGADVLLGLSEEAKAVFYITGEEEAVQVWGEGATDRFLPPGPCRADGELPPGPCTPVDRALPPGPCFELLVLLADGNELGIEVSVQAENGEIDPGSLVGFNPQPEPPGDFPVELGFSILGAGRDVVTHVNVALVHEGRVLALE